MKLNIYNYLVSLSFIASTAGLISCSKKENNEIRHSGKSSLLIKSVKIVNTEEPIHLNYHQFSNVKVASTRKMINLNNKEEIIKVGEGFPEADIVVTNAFDALIETQAHPKGGGNLWNCIRSSPLQKER